MSTESKSCGFAAGLITLACLAALGGCGSKTPPAAPAAQADAAPAPAATPAPDTSAQLLKPTATTWSPEGMEELLAPVALYPDPVLGQVLVASSNPQEVLDAGNWLLQNQSLTGNELDEAAKSAGFTAPVRGLLQFPETMDMMCSQMDWTSELGQAFVNDQPGVLDAVQRLRAQARDVGNLKSSEQMTVATEVQDGKEVVTVSPPTPQVVYVPQYDPVAAYAPAPATTTTTETKSGHSTGSMVATGLLSFGAGLVVANIFDDDDDDWNSNGYYSPRYYGPPMPYYPPSPYRPRYGNGYYPSQGYNRPPNYQHNYNNNTVVINQNNNYWNGRSSAGPVSNRNAGSTRSPITAAKPGRTPPQESWKGQSGYAGAKPGTSGAARPGADVKAPKVQGTYSNAAPAAKPVAGVKQAASTDRKLPASSAPQVSKPASRPAAAPAAQISKPATRPAAAPAALPAKAPSQASPQSAPKARAPDRAPANVPAKAPAKVPDRPRK
jgi:hypothetical protein